MVVSDGPERSLLAIQWTGRGHARSAHHIENAGCKAEQQKHDHSPGRNSEPAIHNPTERRADQDAGDEFGREPKAPRDRRGIRGLTLIRTASERRSGWTWPSCSPRRLSRVESAASLSSGCSRSPFSRASSAMLSTPASVLARSRQYPPPKSGGP